MWSFIGSVILFVVLGVVLILWRHVTKKKLSVEREQIDQQINAAAEVAQRRHKSKFGRASTDLNDSLNGAVPRNGHRIAHSKS